MSIFSVRMGNVAHLQAASCPHKDKNLYWKAKENQLESTPASIPMYAPMSTHYDSQRRTVVAPIHPRQPEAPNSASVSLISITGLSKTRLRRRRKSCGLIGHLNCAYWSLSFCSPKDNSSISILVPDSSQGCRGIRLNETVVGMGRSERRRAA